MLAKVFDHCSMKYKKGFRLLTLGWSDGNSFVPINHCLLSAAKDVMIELLKETMKSGHQAKYVLFDSWFSSPKAITSIKKQFHLDTIAMVKVSFKVFYEYKGENLSIKQIYSKNKKRRGRSKYLLSIDVMAGKENDKIPAKLLSISQRSNEDTKTICEIFYYLADELADITFSHSFQILMQAMIDTIAEFFHITEEQLAEFTSSFVNRLPKYLRFSLGFISTLPSFAFSHSI